MTVDVNDLIAFLLARIGEQQIAAARGLRSLTEQADAVLQYQLPGERIGAVLPDQVFRECEAKRRIVEQLDFMREADALRDSAEHLLRLLALPYADHPDFREEWRP
jgi:hypothetical protein